MGMKFNAVFQSVNFHVCCSCGVTYVTVVIDLRFCTYISVYGVTASVTVVSHRFNMSKLATCLLYTFIAL
jgi:hypothetical protein